MAAFNPNAHDGPTDTTRRPPSAGPTIDVAVIFMLPSTAAEFWCSCRTNDWFRADQLGLCSETEEIINASRK